ncbi:hypothetical protein Ade02nite_81400 [Paractinoplanes deccanensis]|uniref:Prepilin-type N-terminal cleavage/methylation domain-containing protein n=1 Tax=Paractinoplanes deccanensis TaxID=113561 RepID=A0ABQ3YHL2_9ACTN|nr:putative Ig domain-containing protein [Actinoplanes deccanensis]GID79499.1 hypothetical protein Ade02nite_81400 [Actinoplanes deccanensis]
MPTRRRARVSSGEAGFTIVEVIVAIAIVTIVMLSLASTFVVSSRVTNHQGDRLAAIQAADDAMERVRALQSSAILTGRDLKSSTAQAQSAPAEVKALVNGVMAYDSSADDDAGTCGITATTAPSAATSTVLSACAAALPTSYLTFTLNGVVYRQHWYIYECARKDSACTTTGVDDPAAGYTQFFQVVVSVTWTGRFCATGTCAYASSSLIGRTTDEPIFNTKVTLTSPGDQTHEQTVAVSVQVPYAGGEGALTWGATGLPPGLTIDTGTGLITGRPTTVGSYTPTVVVTDNTGQTSSISFNWAITSGPVVAGPTAVTSNGGTTVSQAFTATLGTTPYTWTATGLPPGLTIGSGTGTVTGKPTTAGTFAATITATDKVGAVGTHAVTWTVPALAVTFTPPAAKAKTAITSTSATATGGVIAYKNWTATGLPSGVTINATSGQVSGTPGAAGTYTVKISVTDSAATPVTASWTGTWTVTS